jgi:hypothetical protein
LNTHNIYQPDIVIAVQQLHQDILERRLSYPSVFHELRNYAINLQGQYQAGNPAVTIEISNHFPPLIAASPKEIFYVEMEPDDFELTIAKAYGFNTWEDVKAMSETAHDPAFEMAVDILLTGQIDVLGDHLKQYPHLIHQRSVYGHRAGLIHYLGANGVEIWRQIVPDNVEDILRFLVLQGADPDMTANLYGVNNLLALLTSSDHAWKAGVAKTTIQRLKSRVF